MLQKYWVCSQFEIKGVTAYAVLHTAIAACVLLMWVGRLLRRCWWLCYHTQALPTNIRKSFVKSTQDLLLWGVTAYAV